MSCEHEWQVGKLDVQDHVTRRFDPETQRYYNEIGGGYDVSAWLVCLKCHAYTWKILKSLESYCQCTNEGRGLFTWREDPEWWSCVQCDGRVRGKTKEELEDEKVE